MSTYEIVTERIINLLEQGVVSWRRPWSAAGAPRNLVSKKTYRGVNFFLLSATKHISRYWVTLKQANELGGSVRKGERGEIVVFWRVDEGPNIDPESDPAKKLPRAIAGSCSDFTGFGTWNSAACRKRLLTNSRRSKRISTIRSKRPSG